MVFFSTIPVMWTAGRPVRQVYTTSTMHDEKKGEDEKNWEKGREYV